MTSPRPVQLSYQLRVGVTGHRHLARPAEVRAAAETLIATLKAILNSAGGCPLTWVAVSPLAKGADRVVAQTILKEPGAKLEVVTPSPLKEYKQDFADPEDLAEFEALAARACRIVELNSADAASASPKDRGRKYLDVGRSVVESSEILIAVWDGRAAQGRGGTAEIVRHALRRGRTVLWIHSEEPSRPAARLLHREGTPRAPEEEAAGFAFAAKPIAGDTKSLSPGYAQFEEYCRETSASEVEREARASRDAREFRSLAAAAGLPADDLEGIIGRLLPHQTRAAELAARCQRRHLIATLAIFACSAAAVTVAALGALVFKRFYVLLGVLEVCLMIGAVASVTISKWRGWHEKWLHYRYLAEQLRTASFAMAASVEPASLAARPAGALPFYSGPTDWLHGAVEQIAESAKPSGSSAFELEALKKFLIRGWLAEQRDWHHRKSREKESRNSRLHLGVLASFALTLVMALLHTVGLGHGDSSHGDHGSGPGLAEWISFLAIALPSWGAAAHAIGKQLELERIAERYERMAETLAAITDRAQAAASPEELRAIVIEAAELMRLEAYDWCVLLSFNPSELAA